MDGSVSESTVVMTPPAGSPGTSDEEWEVEASQHSAGQPSSSTTLNGEVIRESMAQCRKRQGIKAAVWGIGWGMSIVGLWGDAL